MYPLISIIVPVFNVEHFLEECVESIINQSYKNLEIILINDGSTDQSGQICEFYASKNEKIKIFHKENGGLSEARNLGLDKATGEYLSFIDSDDYVHPKFIEILYANLIENNADVSFCSVTYKDFSISKKQEYLDFDSFLYFENQMESVIMCNKLFKRDIWRGIRFDVGKYHEDEFIYHKVFYKRTFIYTASKLYFYRKRDGSIMRISNEKRRKDARMAFEERYLFFKNKNERYAKKVFQDIIHLNIRYFNAYRDKESILFLRRKPIGILALSTYNWKEKLFLIKNIWLSKNLHL